MALKTFNIDESVYIQFSKICRETGMSMSKQVEMFMRSFADEEPRARAEYVRKLEKIRKGKFIKVASFSKRYGV